VSFPRSSALRFAWKFSKAAANERKHSVSFHEATTVFRDPLSVTGFDPNHSDDEDRFVTMGTSASGQLLVVVHGARDECVRIISARWPPTHTHPPHLFRLDPDIASAFPDEEAVNSALRQFLAEHPRENAG